MGSLELHAAVAGGTPEHADAMMRYMADMKKADADCRIAWGSVERARADRGMEPPEPYVSITPDFGPMPRLEPGSNVITNPRHGAWIRLMGTLKGGSRRDVAACLRMLNGWVYQADNEPRRTSPRAMMPHLPSDEPAPGILREEGLIASAIGRGHFVVRH